MGNDKKISILIRMKITEQIMKTFKNCAFCTKCAILERFHEFLCDHNSDYCGDFFIIPHFPRRKYHKPNIRKKNILTSRGACCFATLQNHNGSRPHIFFKIVVSNSTYKNLSFLSLLFYQKDIFHKIDTPY